MAVLVFGRRRTLTQILIGRHGSTAFNNKDKRQERIRAFVDLPLDEEGERDAQALAANMSQYPIGHIYCSPLVRARQTARTCSKVCGVPMSVEKALEPWHCGDSIQSKRVVDVLPLIKYYAAHPKEAPKNGEPFQDFCNRYLNFLSELISRSKSRTSDFALVAHSRNIRLSKAWQMAGRPKDFSFNEKTMNDYASEDPPGSLYAMYVK